MDILKGVMLSVIAITSTPYTTEYEAPKREEMVRRVELVVMTDPLFEKIGYCESKHILTAKNPGSTAKGEFQFLDGTWKNYGPRLWGDDWVNKDVLSADNRELAWFVYTHYGVSDWTSDPLSYNCWKSELPNATHLKIYANKP